MTPEDWRALAEQAKAEALELARAGKVDEAVFRSVDAQRYLATADQLERLTAGSHGGNLPEMLPAARVRQSKGASRGKTRDALAVVASDAGHTIRSIAEELGCSHVFLLKARAGVKAIRYSWAQKVQAMTRSPKHPDGFTATGANWPGGWAREE